MEEKMMILKMLEEGKITSDEALRLLDSLENKNTKDKNNFKEFKSEPNHSNAKFNDTINKFSKKAEEFADKFGPDFVSKVESISGDFADAAVKFADKVVSYINSSFSNTDIYKTVSKNYSFPIEGSEKVKVMLRTQNLAVTAGSTDSSEVSLNMKLNVLFENADDIGKYISARYENGVIYVSTDLPVRTWGTLEIKLPKAFENLEVETSNSKCIVEGLMGTALHCNTSNGKIEIRDCEWEKLNAKTNNSKILILNTKAQYASADTSNSSIELDNSSFDRLKSTTSNGSINLAHFNSIKSAEAEYMLQTTNGKIRINIPKNSNSGYKINARTTIGNINISELESSYLIERKTGSMNAQASIITSNYDNCPGRISIEAVTSNSSINIGSN